jgi:archaellum component FlaG (FlaF/FlaG flagellin family)
MRIDGNLPITTIKQELPNCAKSDETVKEPADSVILSSNVEYSKIGQLLAKTTFDSGINVNTAPEQRKIQREGLASIVSNTSTTEDEKTLSTLGITMGDHRMYDVSAARARNIVLSTISGGISGPIGSVVANLTMNAGGKMEDASEQRQVQKDGLQVIAANAKTSQEEKNLASLGVEFGDSRMYDISAAKARNIVLKTISGGISGPIGYVIATVTSEAGGKMQDAPEQRALQRQGLKAIIANPGVSKETKAIAELGVTFGDSRMYDISAARARNVVLSAIKNGIEGSIGSVIAKVTYDAGVKMEDAQEQRALQRQGFEAIIANPDTTEEQKLLAKQGIEVGNNNMYDSSAAKARNVILQAIIDGK